MTYLNFPIADLRLDEFMSADNESRGILLCLLAFCSEQENGGIIKGCIGWPELHWQRAIGISKEDVKHSSSLWKWSGDNLIVPLYNHKHEAGHKARRQAAIITNQKRWGMRENKSKVSLTDSHSESLSVSHSESLSVSQRKKERKKSTATAPQQCDDRGVRSAQKQNGAHE